MIKKIQTSQLFFNQYRWGADVYLTGISCLRGWKNTDHFDEKNLARVLSRRRSAWIYVSQRPHNVVGSWGDPTTDPQLFVESARQLQKLHVLLKHHRERIKFTVGFDHGYVYTNGQDVLDDISSLDFLRMTNVREAVVTLPRDTVLLRETEHNLRTYFREKSLDRGTAAALKKFLSSQKHMRLGPSLKNWCGSHEKDIYTRSHWFLDHETVQDLMLLNIVCHNIVRRTIPIIKVNN
jgi:hypothetical protein